LETSVTKQDYLGLDPVSRSVLKHLKTGKIILARFREVDRWGKRKRRKEVSSI
jgi:hypothetical protein